MAAQPMSSLNGVDVILEAISRLKLAFSCCCRMVESQGSVATSNGSTDLQKLECLRLHCQVGTAVVTQADGRLALGRIGALCEQVKELNYRGLEVILVTSGAIGVGRQRLRYRRLVNSSFADLQKPQRELDGKACAAVGQNGLMALYDALFSQLDVTSSQLLVTDNDFKDQNFRMQLCETVNSLLALRVIPVFNENDAISTRRAPYEFTAKENFGQDSSGIFWDNDSLAALLALELKADLLVLLSDVEGLYSGPPGEPHSKLIHTYIKEKHQGEITFGHKSRVGRGGMTAKVKAAVYAAYAGIPVVITSGYATDNVIKVLEGKCVGTLFHLDAHLWAPSKEVGACEMAVAARECSRKLQISSLAMSIRVLADMEDPIGQVLKKTESFFCIDHYIPSLKILNHSWIQLADGLILEKTSSPLGVLLIVFESRPDALVQIASLAVRSGNGLLLKGGKEATRSNAILHKIITSAIPDTVGDKLIGLVTSRDEIPDLLKLDDVIDLVIPRGSNKLVTQIKESTKIPVLGHADGICHIYVDKSANMDMAKSIVLDAKTDYPAACNAMETLLVHEHLLKTSDFNDVIVDLKTEGVTLYGGPRASALLNIPEAHSFHHEYNSMACTVEIVDNVHAAIDHIHYHEVVEIFLRQILETYFLGFGGGFIAQGLSKLKVQALQLSCNESNGSVLGSIIQTQVAWRCMLVGLMDPIINEDLACLSSQPVVLSQIVLYRNSIELTVLLWQNTRILRGSGQVVDGDKGVVYTHRNIPLQS
ncbi:Delta-1-pyrroline-5-carboxylate synthase [Asimina triloba]